VSAGQGQKAADAGVVECPALMLGTVPDDDVIATAVDTVLKTVR